MSKISKLKQSLTDLLAGTDVFVDGSALVPKPDYKSVEKKLKPVERGQSRGEQGLPPDNTKDPDEVEREIRATYQEMVSDTARTVGEQVQSYNARLIGCDISSFIDDLKTHCMSAVADFKAQVKQDFLELQRLNQKVTDKRQDLENFRAENELRRSADYPEGASSSWRWAIILVIFLIESLANAGFLAKANEGGLIGAYIEAIAFSAVNIITGCLAGSFFRYRNYQGAVQKVGAWALLLSGATVALLLNLALAHYREVSGMGLVGAAGQEAFVRMMASPMGLEEIQGWILFALGFLFWVISAIDAYGLDDRYPGYGRVDRSLRVAIYELSEARTIVIDELRERRVDGEDELKETRKGLSQLHNQVSQIFTMKDALINDWKQFTGICEDQCAQMLGSYRDANRSVRQKAPRSFNAPLPLQVPDLSAGSLNFSLDDIGEQVVKGGKRLEETQEEFYQEFNSALSVFGADLDEREPAAASAGTDEER